MHFFSCLTVYVTQVRLVHIEVVGEATPELSPLARSISLFHLFLSLPVGTIDQKPEPLKMSWVTVQCVRMQPAAEIEDGTLNRIPVEISGHQELEEIP